MTPLHRTIVDFYWSQYSVSDVAFLSGQKHGRTVTQDTVREVWRTAIFQGVIAPIPGYERPREGFPPEILMLGPIGNQCSPERRVA
jgi:hypothetical protein